MTPDRTLNLHKGMKSTRNCKYVNKLFSHFKNFLKISDFLFFIFLNKNFFKDFFL